MDKVLRLQQVPSKLMYTYLAQMQIKRRTLEIIFTFN